MLSTSTLILIVLLVILGMIVLVGASIFLFLFLKAIRDLNQSLNKAMEVLGPMSDGVRLKEVLDTVQHVCKVGIELGRRTDVLVNTLSMMHKAIFSKSGVPEIETAVTGEGSSGFYSSTEEDLARKEMEKQLRDRGIKVSEKEAYEPSEKEGVTTKESSS